jgi:hypothetical protein
MTNRYCCDVDNCNNYAYAELYHLGKSAWMYICKKHYKLKLSKKGMPKEKDVGFSILKHDEIIYRKNVYD